MARRQYDPDRHCGAHPDDEAGPCRAYKGSGTDHVGFGRCKHHGGNSPSGRAASHREIATAAVRELRLTAGISRPVDPAQALLEEIARTAGVIDWLGEQVERVAGDRPDNLVQGTRSVKRVELPDGHITTTEVGPMVHEWVKLWQAERRHLANVCRIALAAGVEERRVRLAEQQGNLLASVIRAVLADLDLSPAQEARVPDVVPRHLRMVSGS